MKTIKDMKQVVIYETDTTLSDYSVEEETIVAILRGVKKQAEDLGYTDITFKFRSTMEPYDDYLGSPSVVAEGWIAKTQQDLDAEAKELEQNELAKKLGCTYYEAGQYMMLQEKGVIK